MSVACTVVAPAEPEAVWRRMTDFPGWPAWTEECVSADMRGPLEPGTRLELRMRTRRGRDFYTRPVITIVEPDSQVAWEARSLGLCASTRVHLAPEPDGTRVTIHADSVGPMAFAYRMIMTDRTQAEIYAAMLDALVASLRP